MAIIPTVRCSSLRASLAFYTGLLDFTRDDGAVVAPDDPGFCVLSRNGDPLFLSSHAGDGAFGQAIVVTTHDASCRAEPPGLNLQARMPDVRYVSERALDAYGIGTTTRPS